MKTKESKKTKKATSVKDTKGGEAELLHHPARKSTGIAEPTAKAPKKAKAAADPKKAQPAATHRTATKASVVVELLRRERGATIAEIAKDTDWQKHSIRGFISAAVGKKMGLKVESAKNEEGERAYRVVT